jgi:hypothetical protein
MQYGGGGQEKESDRVGPTPNALLRLKNALSRKLSVLAKPNGAAGTDDPRVSFNRPLR